MQSLESAARRIEAIGNIAGIVRTMKALSAVNIPSSERAASAAEAFHETLLDALHVALRQLPTMTGDDSPMSHGVVIAFGSDHGLCGGFNESVAAAVASSQYLGKGIFAVGYRLDAALRRRGMVADLTLRSAASSEGLRSLAAELILAIDAQDPGRTALPAVDLVHQVRGQGNLLSVVHRNLLPLGSAFLRQLRARPWPSPCLPITLSDPHALFHDLLRQQLAVTIYRAGAASLAAEHAARLALMTQAERALEERLESAESAYRRARQDRITEELLDILGGFQALGDGPGSFFAQV
ncbi:MAG: F0F1 ATP synthase subunit gamma [Kiloniellales bacterium]